MNLQVSRPKISWWSLLGLLVALSMLAASATVVGAYPPPPPPPDEFEEASAVRLLLPDREALNYLVENGWDLDHDVEQIDQGVLVTVIVTPSELSFLESLGFVRLDTVYDLSDWQSLTEEREQALEDQFSTLAVDTVTAMRADYWLGRSGQFVSIEARSSDERNVTMSAILEPAPVFGITCSQAVGVGSVPEGATFKYTVDFNDPGTISGKGKPTKKHWEGYIQGPSDFNARIDWPMPPVPGGGEGASTYSWQIWVSGGPIIGQGNGFFDCAAPLPTEPEARTITLNTFIDAGAYMYHFRSVSVTWRPARVIFTSSGGGSATTFASEWVPGQPANSAYQIDFVEHYMDPTELYNRIGALAAEFPELAEIIDLPYLTNGYRRRAMGLLGTANSNRVVIESDAWGHEGGNGILVETFNPGSPDQPLSVSVSGSTISIGLATDSAGISTSTAAQVVAAINADPAASAVIDAATYRGNAGGGLVPPGSIVLSDRLSAPSEISREPYQVKAIRIGKHRDGSRLGVFFYAQEHAREWVPPLVVLETAERLLRNYYSGGSKELLDNLDIFIIPSVNPDGATYSFYDFASQRKNMTKYCVTSSNDVNSRNDWGVDINRNYDYGSRFDGYSGASGSCSSDTFSGPAELSEPESSNVAWVADTFTNIKFSMNVHSSGNYFMWSPAAYAVPGRETLPRPTLGQESYFWYASDRILNAIKAFRGLVVVPAQTGPVVDVLYSAAGNSGDRLWYVNNIYAWDFEVGGSGFQPTWTEAHAQAMEFANGLIEMLEVARDYDTDSRDPSASLVYPDGSNFAANKKYSGVVSLKFASSEPVEIYYTLDGSRPTYSSIRYSANNFREDGQVLTFYTMTTLNWFAVDAAGNVSNNYDPGDAGNNQYYSATIMIR